MQACSSAFSDPGAFVHLIILCLLRRRTPRSTLVCGQRKSSRDQPDRSGGSLILWIGAVWVWVWVQAAGHRGEICWEIDRGWVFSSSTECYYGVVSSCLWRRSSIGGLYGSTAALFSERAIPSGGLARFWVCKGPVVYLRRTSWAL